MSRIPPLRGDLSLGEGYHSPQAPAEVRLNTNESPFPPPDDFVEEFSRRLSKVDLHRYPDRQATELRSSIAALHGVDPNEIFCANGSNEVLQCLLLAYGGPGRRALVFEPTYALHDHISRLTGTEVVTGARDRDFRIVPEAAEALCRSSGAAISFLCSPNNPTGRAEPPDLVRRVLDAAEGLVVVDEAYGQFSSWSASDLRSADTRALVVVRTFSKTWSMAAVRLGYAIADPEVVAACERTALPYHLSVPTQIAGTLALRYGQEMAGRVALVEEERDRLARRLVTMDVDTWPSDANFILFRPRSRPAAMVWDSLLEQSVLVRNCSTWPGLEGCLRVTIGTAQENDRFVEALEKSLA
jgi:histidinol-phosphate aminotransferase